MERNLGVLVLLRYPPISEFRSNCQRLVQTVNGQIDVAELGVYDRQVVQRHRRSDLVADQMSHREGLLEMVPGLQEATPLSIRHTETVRIPRDPVAVTHLVGRVET